ncbi:MAG: glycosyltransferase family 4 protein [Acidimicrobiia bacterium]
MTARPRVLHLTTTGWNEFEGVARAVQALAARIPADHLLCATEASSPGFSATYDLGGSVMPLPWSRRLRDVLHRARPDVIHLHGGEGVAGAALAIPSGTVPTVVSVYGRLTLPSPARPTTWVDHRRANMALHRRVVARSAGLPMLRTALRSGRVAAVCSPDPAVVQALADTGAAFLARGAADAAHERRANWSDRPQVVFAGRAETGRGIDDLLLAHLRARRVRPDLRLLLALLPSPQDSRWRDLRLPGVEVHVGATEDLAGLLADAQVAALPFRMDATISPAFVAAEAMAVGLPVVAADVACLRCLVSDGGNGRLVGVRRPEELAAALLDVLADEARWRALSDGARRSIETDWSWDGAADVVQHAYHHAIAGAPYRTVRHAS